MIIARKIVSEDKMRSIINDVLGPVMAGPSSSHSAGCARIGRLARLLWGKDIEKAVVVYDKQGSYPSTCEGQGSNFGFTGGLLGMKNDDARLKNSVEIAREKCIDISFAIEKLTATHPNEARIDIYEGDKVGMSLVTFSTGGGMFEIAEMDGFAVNMDGTREQVFILCSKNHAKTIKNIAENHAKSVKIIKNQLVCCENIADCDALIKAVKGQKGVKYVRTAPVIMPIAMKNDAQPVFSTACEALDYAEKTGKALWQLAIDYECSVGDTDESGVMKEAEYILSAMKNAVIPPEKGEKKFGFLPYQCRDMMACNAKIINTGWLEKAMYYAIAVMENSCAHNIVTASPTAGSSGVLPAAILAMGEQMGVSDDEIAKAILAAGLVGSFIANNATFAAETAGCQAENGSASAMAACGVVQLLGGSVKQGFMAASLALQNTLGLVCDPVGGLTEIPCISRNVMAMSNAVMSANMAVLGFDGVIPLDEVIETMTDIGRKMPAELRCTCKGGLCKTRTAKKTVMEMKGEKPSYAYMLRCADGSYYTGWTNDLDKRVRAHNSGKGAKYTKTRTPVELVYYEEFYTKEDAMSREFAIKQLTREEKERLTGR